MPLTDQEKDDLREWIRSKSCNEFRRDESCIDRNDSAMIGDMHVGCYRVRQVLAHRECLNASQREDVNAVPGRRNRHAFSFDQVLGIRLGVEPHEGPQALWDR